VAIPAKWLPVAVLAMAACSTPGRWSKPDTSAEQLAADKRGCEAEAYREVQKRQSRSTSTMGPAVVGGPSGSQARRFNTTPQGPFADQRGTQLSEEEHLVDECMRGKGYERVEG
jgi:hypothetical protein